MRKIVTVLGARPQFIKASAVSNLLRKSSTLREILVHTGQHFDSDMSAVFFEELDLPGPKYNLGISGGTHGEMTGRMLIAIERVLLDERPDAILVYGDTNSTLAAALAACKLQIPIGHVEAGLRSFNLSMPEETNRIVTDRVSRWLFVPTDTAARNLVSEGVQAHQIVRTGDVMFDVALQYGTRVTADGRTIGRLGISPGKYVLATVHRAENTNISRRLEVIFDALLSIAEELPVVWPLHPRTRAALAGLGRLGGHSRRLMLIDPVGYMSMVQLEKYAAVIATDSGGVQKEAYFHRVPCVTMRDETEWVELLETGWNRLAPPTAENVIRDAVREANGSLGQDVSPYGHGDAAARIVTCLSEHLA